jgi:hypothetical protein
MRPAMIGGADDVLDLFYPDFRASVEVLKPPHAVSVHNTAGLRRAVRRPFAGLPPGNSGADVADKRQGWTFEELWRRRLPAPSVDAAVDAAKRDDFWKTPTAHQDLWSDVLDLFHV